MDNRRNFAKYIIGGSILSLSGCTKLKEAIGDSADSKETTKKQRTAKTSIPATGSETSTDDVVIYNLTNKSHSVKLLVTPVSDSKNTFIEEFMLPAPTEEDSDKKSFADIAQMDEKCRVEITVDGERSAGYDWDGDTKDYKGLEIYVEYEEIGFSGTVA